MLMTTPAMIWSTRYLMTSTASAAPSRAPIAIAPNRPIQRPAVEPDDRADERRREQLALDADVDHCDPLAHQAGQAAGRHGHRQDDHRREHADEAERLPGGRPPEERQDEQHHGAAEHDVVPVARSPAASWMTPSAARMTLTTIDIMPWIEDPVDRLEPVARECQLERGVHRGVVVEREGEHHEDGQREVDPGEDPRTLLLGGGAHLGGRECVVDVVMPTTPS